MTIFKTITAGLFGMSMGFLVLWGITGLGYPWAALGFGLLCMWANLATWAAGQ